MRPLKFTFAVSLALLATWPVLASNQHSRMSLGHSGQLQRAVAGSYGDLFPEGDAADPATPVLALEIEHPGEELTRILVPGTEDSRTEAEPILFQDARHDSFVMVWQSRVDGESAYCNFATFGESEWSEVFTLEHEGAPVALLDSPSIAESHDTFDLDLENGESVSAERRILHLLWRGAGEALTRYASLAFVEGQYVGWHHVFPLDDLFLQAPEASGEAEEGPEGEQNTGETAELTTALAQTSSLRLASDGRSVIVTFANQASHRLGTLEINPLRLELGFLGDQVREHILSIADLFDPTDPSSFSDGIRAAIVILGQRFNLHEAHRSYVADQVADWILEDGDLYGWGDLQRLSDDARAMTIAVSNEVYASTQVDPADPSSEIVEINLAGIFENPEQPDPAQTLDFRVRADMPAPVIGEGPTAVYTSRSGAELLVAWQDEEAGVIRWVESRRNVDDGAWSEPFALSLTESLTLEQAHRLLESRIR